MTGTSPADDRLVPDQAQLEAAARALLAMLDRHG